jgi:hypothetical protein|tara:strand:+ start:170 stop:808 length:639 start_codon:yes stop_codon:yes gene_type:complete
MKVTDFTVEEVPRRFIDPFIRKNHYSHSTNGIQQKECFGLYREGNFGLPVMIGAAMYAIPSMPNTAKRYNPDDPSRCVELRRLCCVDDTPTNTESYFISKTFKWLKQNTNYQVVVSFADQHYGHSGVIYKATNFEYLGTTGKSRILMVDGKEYHSRSLSQPVKPYSIEIRRRWEAKDPNVFFVDREPKHKYVYYLDKRLRRKHGTDKTKVTE